MQIILTLRQWMLGGPMTSGHCSARAERCTNRKDSCTTRALALRRALRLCVNVCIPCMCDVLQRGVWLWFSFSAASQCSLYFYGVSMLRYLTAKQLWHQTAWPRSHHIRTGLCAALNPTFFFVSLLHVHVWMDGLYPGRENRYTNFNSTQTIIQPSPGNSAKLNSR